MAKAENTSRRKEPAWSVTLLLAIAVSVWGLHYKLSLYRPQAVRAHGPAAKLLSQKERPAASAQLERAQATRKPLTSARRSTGAPGLADCILFVLAGLPPDRRSLSPTGNDLHPAFLLAARPSTPRPPPITV